MRTHALLLAGAGALALVGCGSGGSGTETVTVVETTAAPASTITTPAIDARVDRRLAQRALLQLSDLPVSWTAAEDESDGVDCAAFAAVRRMPRAVSPRFSHGDEQFASHAVAVYATPQDADAAIDDLVATDTRDCLGDELKAQMNESTDDATIGDVTVSELNVEPLGQRSAALRVQLPISVSGVDADVYADYVIGRVDRGLTMLMVGSVYVEPDEELRATLAKRGVQRLGEALSRA